MLSLRLPHLLLALFLAASVSSCKDNKKTTTEATHTKENPQSGEPFFKISLAQWSLHVPIEEGELDPMDFAQKASELGFDGIEYVSAIYKNRYVNAEDPTQAFQAMLDTLKRNSETYNVRNVLIMVDDEGDISGSNEQERRTAVENHKKWVDAAEFLGAHAIRVNLFGSMNPEEWKNNSVDGLTRLSEYAATKGINVLVENHGALSSNAALLAEVMEEVNLPNCGTLPDFGNFCIRREGGQQWEAKCIEDYPIYQGVEEMMPYAKAVSAKSYDFNEEGQETTIDYGKMLKIVKDAGFTGFIGIEYEGSRLSPEEGI